MIKNFHCAGVASAPHWADFDDQEDGLIFDWERGLEGIVIGDVVLLGSVEDLRRLSAQLQELVALPSPPVPRCERCAAAMERCEGALCHECSEVNSGRVVL